MPSPSGTPRPAPCCWPGTPLGIKPLYLARAKDASGGWTLAFASEVRALLASGLLGPPKLDASAAASLVWNGFIVGPRTAVQGVESLGAGQLRLYEDTGKETLREDFAPYPRAEGGPLDEETLAAELEESVRLHLISDVPLAVFLSSGIDSSAVANLAHRAGKGRVHTFTLAFEESAYNEGPLARQIADAIGTQHQEVLLAGEGLRRAPGGGAGQPGPAHLRRPEQLLHVPRRPSGRLQGGPGGDGRAMSCSAATPASGTCRRCTGCAAGCRGCPRAALARAAQLAVDRLQPAQGAFPRQTRWAKLPDMVRGADSLLALYQLAYALFLPDFQEQLLGGVPPPSGTAFPRRRARGFWPKWPDARTWPT